MHDPSRTPTLGGGRRGMRPPPEGGQLQSRYAPSRPTLNMIRRIRHPASIGGRDRAGVRSVLGSGHTRGHTLLVSDDRYRRPSPKEGRGGSQMAGQGCKEARA